MFFMDRVANIRKEARENLDQRVESMEKKVSNFTEKLDATAQGVKELSELVKAMMMVQATGNVIPLLGSSKSPQTHAETDPYPRTLFPPQQVASSSALPQQKLKTIEKEDPTTFNRTIIPPSRPVKVFTPKSEVPQPLIDVDLNQQKEKTSEKNVFDCFATPKILQTFEAAVFFHQTSVVTCSKIEQQPHKCDLRQQGPTSIKPATSVIVREERHEFIYDETYKEKGADFFKKGIGVWLFTLGAAYDFGGGFEEGFGTKVSSGLQYLNFKGVFGSEQENLFKRGADIHVLDSLEALNVKERSTVELPDPPDADEEDSSKFGSNFFEAGEYDVYKIF